MPRDWDGHYRAHTAEPPDAAPVLASNIHLLPAGGRALDLACGRGGNALALARAGLETFAWDSAPAAIDALATYARSSGVTIHGEVRDVAAAPPEPGRFDVIVVSHFLERTLAPALVDALRPGGLLFYQTFTRARVTDRGPRNEQFRLAENELLSLFSTLRLRFYREEGRTGDCARGFRDEAQLIAQK